MAKNNSNKAAELIKYRDLVLATLDYHIDGSVMKIKTADFDSDQYYQYLKREAAEHCEKGRLTKLKQWFRDLTEMQVASRDLKFNKYLREKTNYDIDIFSSYFQRIEKIIKNGKITTGTQFYDVKLMMDELDLSEALDNEKLEILDTLLTTYDKQKARKK